MGDVVLHISMSLDGFIAGPNIGTDHPLGERGERLHEWLFGAGDARDAEVAREMFSTETSGAVVMGRRTFDVGIDHWGEDGTYGMPCFVLTHRPAEVLTKGPTTFSFVTEGIDHALEQARAAAGDKAVNVMGAATAQQLLRAGQIDQMQLNVIPVLLGGGARLFDGLGPDHIELERTNVIATSGVTHLRFRVLK